MRKKKKLKLGSQIEELTRRLAFKNLKILKILFSAVKAVIKAATKC